MAQPTGQSDVPWGPRPDGPAVGTRPHADGGGRIELMIALTHQPPVFIPLSRREAFALRQAIKQASNDSAEARR